MTNRIARYIFCMILASLYGTVVTLLFIEIFLRVYACIKFTTCFL